MAIADRIAVMNGGELVQLGPPLDVYQRPRNLWVARFIGEHPINVIEASLSADGVRLLNDGGWLSELPASLRAAVQRNGANGKFLVGIRPEHLALAPVDESAEAPGRQAEVYTRQILGTDILYELVTNGELLRAVTPTSQVFEIGDQVTMRFDWRDAFAFDAESGDALE